MLQNECVDNLIVIQGYDQYLSHRESFSVKTSRFFIYLMVCFIPLVSFSVEKSAMTSRWARINTSDIFGAMAILFSLFSATKKKNHFMVTCIPFVAWVIFGVILTRSREETQNLPLSFSIIGILVILYVFMFSSAGIKVITDVRFVKALFIALVIGAAVESIVIMHDGLGLLGMGSIWFRDPASLRIRGTFRASGQLGQYGMAVLFLCYAFSAWPGMKKKWSFIVLLVAITGGLGAFWASRRSAVYVIIFWIILLVFRSVLTKAGRKSFLTLMLLLLIGIIAVWQSMSSYHFSEFTKSRYEKKAPTPAAVFSEGSFTRKQLDEGIDIIEKYPIFGCGFEHGIFYTPEKRNEIHNGFIAIMAETGFIGALFITIPMVLLCIKAVNVYRMSRGTIWADFSERIVLPFIAWIPFSAHNRMWRDRAFWIAVIIVFAMEEILKRISWESARNNNQLNLTDF